MNNIVKEYGCFETVDRWTMDIGQYYTYGSYVQCTLICISIHHYILSVKIFDGNQNKFDCTKKIHSLWHANSKLN